MTASYKSGRAEFSIEHHILDGGEGVGNGSESSRGAAVGIIFAAAQVQSLPDSMQPSMESEARLKARDTLSVLRVVVDAHLRLDCVPRYGFERGFDFFQGLHFVEISRRDAASLAVERIDAVVDGMPRTTP